MNDITTVEATSWHSYPSIYNIGHPAVSDSWREDRDGLSNVYV